MLLGALSSVVYFTSVVGVEFDICCFPQREAIYAFSSETIVTQHFTLDTETMLVTESPK